MAWIKKNYFVLLIAIIGFIIYANSLFNGFVWDDREQIVDNVIVHNFANFGKFFTGSTFYQGGQNLVGIYYRPVMTTVFSLLYSTFGSNPFPYHLTSLILHILNAVLIFLLFKKFFSKNLAFFLSIIFLVHPINTEVVDYISSLGDTLSFSFGMLALLLFMESKKVELRKLILISILFTLSLLSKETGLLFLIGSLVYRVFYFKDVKYWLVPGLTSTSIYVFLRTIVAKIHVIPENFIPIMAATNLEKLLTAPKIIAYFLNDFFFPSNLAISQQWIVRTMTFKDFYLPIFEILILAGFMIFLFFWVRRVKEDKYIRIFIFCSFIFLTGIIAHLHIFPLFETAADRWFYVPIVGLLGLIGIFLSLFSRYTKTIPKFIVIDLAVVVFSLLAIRTFVRNFNWKDGVTLYSHDIRVNSSSFELQNNVGNELFRNGKPDQAKKYFENSVILSPTNFVALYNLGLIYFQEKNIPKAKFYYQKVVDLNNNVPFAFENYAKFLVTYDSPTNARDFVLKSVLKFPNDSSLWATLAVSYSRLNERDKALAAGKKAFELNPNPINTIIIQRLQKGIKL